MKGSDWQVEDLIIKKKKVYRTEHDDEIINTDFIFEANGDEEDGSNLLSFRTVMHYKELHLETIVVNLTIQEARKMSKFLSEAIKEHEEWDWKNDNGLKVFLNLQKGK
jgi:hypothetical protein